MFWGVFQSLRIAVLNVASAIDVGGSELHKGLQKYVRYEHQKLFWCAICRVELPYIWGYCYLHGAEEPMQPRTRRE